MIGVNLQLRITKMSNSIVQRTFLPWFLVVAATVIAAPSLSAQDKIILKNGTNVEGEILSVDDNGGVTVKISAGMVPYPKNNIERVELKERPEYAAGIEAVAQQDYQTAIDKLKPLVDKFLGIDSDWVAESAGGLAESLAQTGKTHDRDRKSVV
jgi:hypothetical protein